jgi:hypothetical protein
MPRFFENLRRRSRSKLEETKSRTKIGYLRSTACAQDVVHKTEKRRQSVRRQTRRAKREEIGRNRLSLPQKEDLAKQIREYSADDIANDYQRLRDIGCRAKRQSNKMLVGNRVVDAFTFTERLNTVGSKGINFYDFWENRELYSRKKYVKNYLVYANRQHRQTTAKVWYNLYRFYFTSTNCFRPLVAMEYYCMFSPTCILDMTAGWGGRLVGACALDIPGYIGIDNNPALREPYARLTAFLEPQTRTKIDMRFCDALTVDYSKLKYDMVFTSPPYYDLEQYGDTSFTKISKTEWDNEFYRPLFRETFLYLAKGGYYCLNIPSEIFERVCYDVLGNPWKRIPLKKNNRKSSKKYVEYVYIWKK